MPSMIGGHRFLVSPLTSFEIVRASVSSRCTRLSASLRGARAASSLERAATWPASLACAVFSDCARLCCAASTAAASAARSPNPLVSSVSCRSSRSTLAISWSSRANRPRWVRTFPKLSALGGEVGERCGQLGEQALGGSQGGFRFGNAPIDAATFFDARFDLVFQLGIFAIEPLQRHRGVGGLLLLARNVGRKLRQPPVEFGDALLGALFLTIEDFARIGEALEACCGASLGLAQGRQLRSA